MFSQVIIPLLISCSFLVDACPEKNSSGSQEYEEEVIIYNTYGYSDGDRWVIPMRVYVLEERGYLESIVTRAFNWMTNFNEQERDIFRYRIADFLADSESGEDVVFMFRDDPEKEAFRIRDEEGNYPVSNLNGIIEGFVTLTKSRAEKLLRAQSSDDGWLDVVVISNDHKGAGKVRLTAREGLSVVTDIDDTIKITGMPMGRDFVIRKAFFEEYQLAPGMSVRYSEWTDAAFHYVSGTPWQFYRPLYRFLLCEENFPQGTFHMKFVPKNFGSLVTWRSLRELITNEQVTFDQKVRQISDIVNDFPAREFILVGDSGERDPEVYREIESRFPDQVREVIIRDVVNDRERNPERLEGMTVIPAVTYDRGIMPDQIMIEESGND